MKKFKILISLLLAASANAQDFEEHSSHEGIYYGTSIWVEKENSTYQDLVIVGYDNNFDQQGTIISYDYLTYDTVGTKIMGFGHGIARQIDANNDGIFDFITAGNDTTVSTIPSAHLYTQNSNGIYTETILPFEGVTTGAIEVADLNYDGFDDIVIIGQDSNGKIAKLYLGDGNNGFTEHTTPFFANIFGDIEIFDADNDSKLDVVISGFNGSNVPTTALYINDGNANFTEQTNTGLVNVYFSGISAADFNNDGNTDLLISGMSDSYSPTTAIFLNNGTGIFTEAPNTNLNQLYFGTADFIDFNLDGHQDVFLTGMDSGGTVITALHTNNNGTLTEEFITSNVFENVYISSVDCSDFDKDGDKDILISGFTDSNISITKVYENKTNQGCIPDFNSIVDEYEITNIQFREINNSTPNNGQEYEDFSTILSSINRGESHQISVTGASPNHPSDVMVYIDFNQNNDFSDAGEGFYLGQISASTTPLTLTQNIQFEDTTHLGYMRMRVIKSVNTSGQSQNSITDPCQQNLTMGQTEDYTLMIKESPYCPLPSSLTYNMNADYTIEVNWTEPIDLNTFSEYNWKLMAEGDDPQLDNSLQEGNESQGTDFTILNSLPGGIYDFYLYTNCGTDLSNRAMITLEISNLGLEKENIETLIYPNPTSNYLNIRSQIPITLVEIYNMNGELIHQDIIESNNKKINVSKLSKGSYLVKLSNNKNKVTKKLFIN